MGENKLLSGGRLPYDDDSQSIAGGNETLIEVE